MIVSDHGFHSFRKEFNTNTWLVKNGYMTLKDVERGEDQKKLDDMFSGGSFFPNVDWSKTKAYALGLGHIYINLKGREAKGIVEPGEEYHQLIEEIRAKIIQYDDPDTNQPVLQNTYFRDDIYEGDQIEHAGDIQLTFNSGYRTSWQTSLGGVPEHIVVANLKKWSGDHCASDYTNTSGFFVSNRKLTTPDPNIVDIAPTLYQVFGVEIPEAVDGKPLELRTNEDQ
jgi:predicted AlkP superfamily phosphohydrolase/phosphomutase